MLIEEAKTILASHGYDVLPMPSHLISEYGPGHLWMNEDPNHIDYDAISERDAVQLAEALHGKHQCSVCQEPAISRCPDCGQWTCQDDRRDFSPKFDDHLCIHCVDKRNIAVLTALALKEEQSRQ